MARPMKIEFPGVFYQEDVMLRCRNLFIIIMVCFFSLWLVATALTENSKEQEHPGPEKFLEALAGSLSHIANFEISAKKENYFTSYSFLNKGIKEIRIYNFKSQKPLSENRAGKTYLRFQLSIVAYKSTASAKTALEALLDYSDPNIGLSYAWDYVVNVGPTVYWLNAPCLLSKQNWQKLLVSLKKNILKNSEHDSFECRCGLNCKRNWNK